MLDRPNPMMSEYEKEGDIIIKKAIFNCKETISLTIRQSEQYKLNQENTDFLLELYKQVAEIEKEYSQPETDWGSRFSKAQTQLIEIGQQLEKITGKKTW